MARNDFKAFIFKELSDIKLEMAANVRAMKLRKTYGKLRKNICGNGVHQLRKEFAFQPLQRVCR
jgi:hypothetical protein